MTILLYGDTVRYPALRHEVPLEIMDPFLFVDHDGRAHVMTNTLEADRIAEVLPGAELVNIAELGLYELVEEGMSRDDAELEVAVRALRRWGVDGAVAPFDLPVAVADRLRGEGIALEVDPPRRRGPPAREERGGAGGHPARPARGGGRHGGRREADPRRRAARRAADRRRRAADRRARARGDPRRLRGARRARAPPDIMVTSALSGGGHDPGSGPLPADLPITIDLWPRDEQSGCWADMTRTFVNGTVSDEVATLRDVVRDALESVRAAARPGVGGRELYDIAAEVVERAGHPTQRTRKPGETLSHGFYFGLGHGVGLEVHEPPGLGLAGGETLVAGDVIAVEPGIEGLDGIGGVRFEDLLLITDDGCETLTDYPYDL